MERKHWSSRLAFIIAAIGSAVGVGNIWRFPYLVGQNNGGTFIVAYVIFLLFFGIPFFFLEIFCGKHFSLPAIKIFERLNKKFSFLFWLPFLFNFVIFSYYIVITGWTFYYFLSSLGGFSLPFNQFSHTNFSIIFDILIAIILLFIMRTTIQSGLEKVNLYLMPLFAISLFILLGNSISLPGFSQALSFYTSFNLSKFLEPSLWLAALSQVIFSLSIGYGIMLTYGSYLKNKDDTIRSSIIISISDTAIALIAGLIIFSSVFTFNLDPTDGVPLAFQSLPLVFHSLPFGSLLMSLFFFLLFAAALTSAVSMAELILSTFESVFHMKRETAAVLSIGSVLLFSLPSAISHSSLGFELEGQPFLDFLDSVVVKKFAPLAILVTLSFLAYSREVERSLSKSLPKPIITSLLILLRYIIPLFLLVTLLKNFTL